MICKAFLSNLRVFMASTNDNGVTWYVNVACDATLLDDSGELVLPENALGNPAMAAQTMNTLTGIEYADSATDLRNELEEMLNQYWTQITTEDTVSFYWLN